MKKFVVKKFEELTNDELWAIYNIRSKVFVVEQQCAYLDVDEYDKVSYHLLVLNNDELCGYARILPKGCMFDSVSIGRVISLERRCGLGTAIVKEAIRVAVDEFDAEKIVIEAQTYAKSLYEKCGFVAYGDEFLEDGIPHIHMEWKR